MIRALATALGRQSIAILALVVAVSGGTAYAASALFTGANIVDGSLTGADVGNGTLTGADIQNGSITSADLAAGTGGGGSVAPLVSTSIGPVAVDPDVAAASPNFFNELIASTFTVGSDGFVNLYVAPQYPADSTAVCGDGQAPSVLVVSTVDGAPLGNGISGDPSPAGQTLTNTIWLTAGAHTVGLAANVQGCGDGGSFGTGAINFSARVLAMPAG